MKPIGQKMFEGYTKKILSRKTRTKARNYMQETTEPYLRFINWQNDTLEDDLRLFWSSASRCYAAKSHADYVKIMDWIKEKNGLFPKQVVKLLMKS